MSARLSFRISTDTSLQGQIVSESRFQEVSQGSQRVGCRFRKPAGPIGRQIQNQGRIPAYRLKIHPEKTFWRQNSLTVMVKPSSVGSLCVAFTRKPYPAVLRTIHAVAFRCTASVLRRPVGLPRPAGFVANPSGLSSEAPHHAVRTHAMDTVPQVRNIIICVPVHTHDIVPAAIESIPSVCSVEPHFKLVVTIFRKFGTLSEKDFADISVRAIVLTVSVPR